MALVGGPHPVSTSPLGGVPECDLALHGGSGHERPGRADRRGLDRERRRGPGHQPMEGVDQRTRRRCGGPVDRGEDLGHLEDMRGWRAGGDPVDQHTGVLLGHGVPQVSERRRRRVRLRLAHLEVALVDVLVRRGRGADELARRVHLGDRGEVTLLEVGQGVQLGLVDVGEKDGSAERMIEAGRHRDERRHGRGVARGERVVPDIPPAEDHHRRHEDDEEDDEDGVPTPPAAARPRRDVLWWGDGRSLPAFARVHVSHTRFDDR